MYQCYHHVTFGFASDVSLATSARGARQDLLAPSTTSLRRYDGSRGSQGPSASPPTSLSALLWLEGLAETSGFASDFALDTTSA